MSSYCLQFLAAISLFVIQTQCKEKHPIKDLGHNLHNYPIAFDSPNLNEGHSAQLVKAYLLIFFCN